MTYEIDYCTLFLSLHGTTKPKIESITKTNTTTTTTTTTTTKSQ
jgi:hypothetical protein